MTEGRQKRGRRLRSWPDHVRSGRNVSRDEKMPLDMGGDSDSHAVEDPGPSHLRCDRLLGCVCSRAAMCF